MARLDWSAPLLAVLAALLGACPPPASSPTCKADEECLAGSFCVEGACISCPSSCPSGEACLRGACLPKACGDQPCHAGEACRDGRCVSEGCAAVTCPSGQACARGQCYPVDCGGGASCGAALVCAEQACTVNACAGVQCAEKEVCADGACRPQSCSGVVCALGSVCDDGRCVDVSCVGVVCGDGTLCSDGRCKPVRCTGAERDCPPGQACEGGACLDLRCAGKSCPSGTVCQAAVCVSCEPFETACSGGVDEDCNALTDCADPTCLGQGCDDGDPATASDQCTADGLCAGSSPTCSQPPNDCYSKAGSYDAASGKCTYPFKSQGVACAASGPCVTGGKCDGAGHCKAEAADCSVPPGPCWAGPGTCDSTTGKCVFTPVALSLGCDDGDRCTTGDACDGKGACAGAPVACTTAPNACYDANGACNPADGRCVYDFKRQGTACDADGNACTVGDACNGAGRCVAGAAKSCPAPGECQDPASCDPASGSCVYPAKADGTVCASNACMSCTGGQCVTARGDGTHIWGAAVCCGGVARDTATDPAHCGGCDTPCSAGFACESVDQTPGCSVAPAGTSGRCRCSGANAQCPRGQVCRTYTPYDNRCTPDDGNGCFSGQYQDISSCPNYCVPHCASGLGAPEPWLALAVAALQLTGGLARRRRTG